MQNLADIAKTDSREEISCLKWTLYNGKRVECVNFETKGTSSNCRETLPKQFIPQRYRR